MSVQLFQEQLFSGGVLQELGCYQCCLYSKMLFYGSTWHFFNDRLFKVRGKISFMHQGSGCSVVLSESSLSLQFPSCTQKAAIPLVCALRCLCSRSLACVTSFPLPVQPVVIITPVFQSPLFPGGMFKIFQSISAEMTQLMAFPTTVIPGRKERRDRTAADSRLPVVTFRELLRQTDHRNIQKSDRGILDCVCGTRAAETN